MSISPSTNLLLIDASQKAGTLILPNPSTLDGHILIIRDIAGTFSQTSTLSIVTPTTHISVATLNYPSSFITLVAAPLGNIQYHVIGGNYLEWVNTSDVNANTISTGIFTSFNPYSNASEYVPQFQTLTSQIGNLSTSLASVSSIIFGTNGLGSLTASNGSLYLDTLPLERGKVYAPQAIQAQAQEYPDQFISSSSSSGIPSLVWFDGKDSNYMFIDSQKKQHPSSIGDKVLYWYAKPSTSKIVAYQTNAATAAAYQGVNGLKFASNGYGYLISNLNINYSNDSSFPLSSNAYSLYSMYAKDPTRLGNYGVTMFGNVNGPSYTPAIYFNYNQSQNTCNSVNLSTTVSRPTAWWGGSGSEIIPFTFGTPEGCNMFSIVRNIQEPYVSASFNGLEVYRGRAKYYSETGNQVSYLGSVPGGGYTYGPTWGDLLFFNNITHSPQQRQYIEGWLAARWDRAGILPSNHIGTTYPRVPVAYRYYKWLITATRSINPNGNAVEVSEFVFQLNGTDQPITSSAHVTNPGGYVWGGGGYPVTNLIDNDLFTNFNDPYFMQNFYTNVIFQFDEPQYFTGYRWATSSDDDSRDPSGWTIQGSQDGETWTLLHSIPYFESTYSRNTWNATTWSF